MLSGARWPAAGKHLRDDALCRASMQAANMINFRRHLAQVRGPWGASWAPAN